ncbi:dipeptide ABC transporter ATP-binding protein [Salinicola sp. MH3R3-1]|uniref:dipeptide ABC transporter ATP-binding protein n=1 Tax=Salinicola sp. MH3R3-1 TaxID=1928762 RepID=UPI00094EDA11|nr:dipeptide ABC transporter ATP-binding protein [Salinicola sp. MH3R3-1]OLO08349.1 dipeptide ABC transporter ATP-binding protein [Salinicola sp. MH3R3-1]
MSRDAVLSAVNLTRYYQVKGGLFSKAATVKALNEASFELYPGQTLAVVGESGCGKSTLARVLTMIEPPTSGKLTISGHEVSLKEGQRPPAALRREVQIIFQNPYGSLNPRKTVATMLEEPLRLNRKEMSAEERRQAALEMIAKVGLRPEHADRYPHMFSGGQRQRIAIARALMLNPKILVLDEPVSALDLSIQAQVLNLLADLQEEFGLAYVFISHDLSVVRRIADDVIVMYFGQPVETGPAEEVFTTPRHPYTQALFSATPVADPNRRRERVHLKGEPPSPLAPPPGCPFAPRCHLATEECTQVDPPLEHVNDRVEVACIHVDQAAAKYAHAEAS